jgi:hypothetical protein
MHLTEGWLLFLVSLSILGAAADWARERSASFRIGWRTMLKVRAYLPAFVFALGCAFLWRPHGAHAQSPRDAVEHRARGNDRVRCATNR